MASNYRHSDIDLDSIFASYSSAPPQTSSGATLKNYNINGTSITNRYQKAESGGDTSKKQGSFRYLVNGETVTGALIGCVPTLGTAICSLLAGTYTLSRSDSELTIKNSSGTTVATYSASTFRDGVVPKYLTFLIVGGGGGASGYGCDEGNKDGYNVSPGAAGGGGGVAVITAYIYSNMVVVAGTGGTFGADGSSSSRPSTSTAGTAGNPSSVYYAQENEGITAYGGSGGSPSKGDSYYGTGGAGGKIQFEGYLDYPSTTYSSVSYSSGYSTTHKHSRDMCLRAYCVGGKGNDHNNSTDATATSLTGVTTQTDVSQSSASIMTTSATGYTYTSSSSYRDSWFGGGCSYGSGATNASTPTYGGGGCANRTDTYKSGADGFVRIYY